MATYTVQAPDGHMITLEGPDGASHEDVIAQAQKLYSPSATATPAEQPGFLATLGHDINPMNSIPALASGIGNALTGKNLAAGVQRPDVNAALPVFKDGGFVSPAAPPASPVTPEALGHAAGSVVNGGLLAAGGAAVGGLLGKIPSAARASANFDKALAAAKDVPIDPAEAYKIALRAQEIGSHGSQPPKVITDFLKQADPQLPPLTYEAGKDFSSNASRLSASERMNLNGDMGRQVKKFAGAMRNATQAAADQAGVGAEHSAAMEEYRRAMQLRDMSKVVKQAAVKAGVTGLLGAGAYGSYKTVKGLLEP